MKTKQTILKAFASLAVAFGAFASADAQTNLGSSCGCPAVGSRTSINVSSLAGYVDIAGKTVGELTQGPNFTCNNTYVLDKKIYIPAGQTLTIAPGTVVKGAANVVAANATALIIERGGKIMAMGTESCPIVFTAAADPMDGTYPVYNVGMWGGIVILGKASNNLTLAANGPFVPGGAGKLAVADGLGTVEGFASSNPQDQYGVATTLPTSYTSSTSPSSATYTIDLTMTGTSNASDGKQRFKISGDWTNFLLNGMTITGATTGATINALTFVSSSNESTVTLSTSGTALSGSYNVTFTGTYPLAPNTTALYSNTTATVTPPSPFANSTTGPIANGLNYAIPLVGAAGQSFDDNDNSGVMKYVSIRHSGAILAVGAEINGLTLASVGRGTTIDHIEIVSCADDNIEIFGGTVNLKYITMLFGNDDMLDYDLGWKGKAQFVFGMKNTGPNATTGLGSPDNDNGIEADSDDNNSNVATKSTPVMYNFTMIGNAKANTTSDNRSLSGVNFKEGSQGELYNSVFANFRNGVNLITTQTGRTSGQNTYDYWNNGSLKIKCNSFVGIGTQGTGATLTSNYLVKDASTGTPVNGTIASGADTTKFLVTDFNTAYFDRPMNYGVTPAVASTVIEPTAIPGFSYAFTISATNSVTVKNDVTPNPALTLAAGCPVAPVDGFFEPAAYRGAFSSQAGQNWLSNWTYSKVLNATSSIAACPTDLNSDGTTDVSDFLIFAPAFNTSCN
jgi:hypothetical protein